MDNSQPGESSTENKNGQADGGMQIDSTAGATTAQISTKAADGDKAGLTDE